MTVSAIRSALFDVSARLSTFPEQWPHKVPNLTPQIMAENGFIFVGGSDEVECFACGKRLDGWEKDDDVIEEHQRRNECIYLSFLRSDGDPYKVNLKVGLLILKAIYQRIITSLEADSIEKNDLLSYFTKPRKK